MLVCSQFTILFTIHGALFCSITDSITVYCHCRYGPIFPHSQSDTAEQVNLPPSVLSFTSTPMLYATFVLTCFIWDLQQISWTRITTRFFFFILVCSKGGKIINLYLTTSGPCYWCIYGQNVKVFFHYIIHIKSSSPILITIPLEKNKVLMLVLASCRMWPTCLGPTSRWKEARGASLHGGTVLCWPLWRPDTGWSWMR